VNYSHNEVIVITKGRKSAHRWLQPIAKLVTDSPGDEVTIQAHKVEPDSELQLGPIVVQSPAAVHLSLVKVDFTSRETDARVMETEGVLPPDARMIVHARYGDSGAFWLDVDAREKTWAFSHFVAVDIDDIDDIQGATRFASMAIKEWLAIPELAPNGEDAPAESERDQGLRHVRF